METRICKKCGTNKPIEEFKKDKSVKSGFALTCKLCWNKEGKLYKLKHIEEVRRKGREYSKTYHVIKRDLVKTKRKQFYAEHKEAELRAGNNWKNNHREEIAVKLKQCVDELSDTYVLAVINHVFGLKAEVIRQHPELIENYRKQIKLKRLIKNQEK